jgi:hypothetical protein
MCEERLRKKTTCVLARYVFLDSACSFEDCLESTYFILPVHRKLEPVGGLGLTFSNLKEKEKRQTKSTSGLIRFILPVSYGLLIFSSFDFSRKSFHKVREILPSVKACSMSSS